MNALQKKQREQTIQKAISAATRLQDKGADLTFRAIAEEAGLSISTVLRPEVKIHLYRNFSIGRQKSEPNKEVEQFQEELTNIKKELRHSQNVNRQLRDQIKGIKEERDKIDLKYRNLLMQYALNIDKKIKPI